MLFLVVDTKAIISFERLGSYGVARLNNLFVLSKIFGCATSVDNWLL